MKGSDLSKLLDKQIQELDSLAYLQGKHIQVMENVGEKWLDVVFNRQGENIYHEILLNGSKRGGRYAELSKFLEHNTDLETMGRKSPFEHFLVRFCFSDEPKFIKPIIIAFYQEDKLKVLDPDQRDEVLRGMEAKGMPIIYDSHFSKSVVENLMHQSLMGSKQKNGLLIYPSESKNIYVLIRKEEANKNIDEGRASELKQEFVNFVFLDRDLKEEFKKSRVDSLRFIDELLGEIKINPEFPVYSNKMWEEANINVLTAELMLVDFTKEYLNNLLGN